LFVQNSGLVPVEVLAIINRSAGAVTLIVLGVIVILMSRRRSFTQPRSGTRLYRSRTDRIFGGVIGGLGLYLGIDPLILRIAVALLTILGSATLLVIVYIVMWVAVPEEPLDTPTTFEVPVPPASGE
jgi:phage shock protein PspC (stress-responsive transcriptional regulator)